MQNFHYQRQSTARALLFS
ncbi:hypothetical protein CBW46_016065 [Paenibacillus xerothermodurans]|uniref:Uncharacterized protein n=1 Tax=Paenibacillus xerothermodurans TaxID=1977292 RepID=A0A2W1N8D4_PAEXE|nr:hypothetical protein CBW46_016065 [Paenibacillus xerothermodurans]